MPQERLPSAVPEVVIGGSVVRYGGQAVEGDGETVILDCGSQDWQIGGQASRWSSRSVGYPKGRGLTDKEWDLML